jgi:hypothetical protein
MSFPQTRSLARQLGLLELHRYDRRYPGLLLSPDSRPASQDQLTSEIKSIYAGLTMVETKYIHMERVQVATLQHKSDPNSKLSSNYWQVLFTLHRPSILTLPDPISSQLNASDIYAPLPDTSFI